MMTPWLEPVDRFCERTVPGLVGQEVLNDWSNLAFVLAALVVLRWHQRRGTLQPRVVFLSMWLAVIGVCSAALHVYPTRLTQGVDALGIAVFLAAFIPLAARQVAGFGVRQSRWLTAAVMGATLLLSWPGLVLGHVPLTVLTFLPSLALMFWLGRVAQPTVRQPRLFTAAGGVFTLSLVAYALDLPACDLTRGLGTHWLWHVCNAVTLGLLVAGLGKR